MRPAQLGPALIALALNTAPALAQTPMTADEFDAFATGKTLEFLRDGAVFGTEAYLPDRSVLLASEGEGDCLKGRWYDKGGLICFAYDDLPGEHCWTIWATNDGLRTLPSFASPTDTPRIIHEAASPLACATPYIGA
jgi:hypothetical protein